MLPPDAVKLVLWPFISNSVLLEELAQNLLAQAHLAYAGMHIGHIENVTPVPTYSARCKVCTCISKEIIRKM